MTATSYFTKLILVAIVSIVIVMMCMDGCRDAHVATDGLIITPTGLQQQLVDLGETLTVDGVPGPITIQAWKRRVELQENQECYDRIGRKIKEMK